MARKLVARYVPALDLATMTDTQVHDLVTAIGAAAPNCAIVQANPPLLTCVTALGTKDTALTGSIAVVTADRAKLAKDLGSEAEDRSDLHGELRTYATLFANVAKSAADLVSGGLTPLPPRPPRNQPPEVPQKIDNAPPKTGHGKTRVSVHETGTTRHQYVAEWSPDPVGAATWQPLGVGLGKTRVVTGTTGTKVWVRFAMVRGGAQSDWSIPILVTIP